MDDRFVLASPIGRLWPEVTLRLRARARLAAADPEQPPVSEAGPYEN